MDDLYLTKEMADKMHKEAKRTLLGHELDALTYVTSGPAFGPSLTPEKIAEAIKVVQSELVPPGQILMMNPRYLTAMELVIKTDWFANEYGLRRQLFDDPAPDPPPKLDRLAVRESEIKAARRRAKDMP